MLYISCRFPKKNEHKHINVATFQTSLTQNWVVTLKGCFTSHWPTDVAICNILKLDIYRECSWFEWHLQLIKCSEKLSTLSQHARNKQKKTTPLPDEESWLFRLPRFFQHSWQIPRFPQLMRKTLEPWCSRSGQETLSKPLLSHRYQWPVWLYGLYHFLSVNN